MRQTIVHNPCQAEAFAHKVQVLLCKGAIELFNAQVHPGGFFCIYFLVNKKDSVFRPVLDLRNLNRFLKFLAFWMLRTIDVLQAVMPQDWFVMIDLKDTCFHVTIAPEHFF